MSQRSVEIVWRIYEGWATSDPRTLQLLDTGIEVRPDPRSAWPGIEASYHGHDGINRYLASIYDAFAEYRAEPEDVLGAGERVAVLATERARGKQSGAPVQIRHTAHVWTIRDGLAVRLDVNWDRDDALRAVGLERPAPGRRRATGRTRVSRHIRVAPAAVYDALLDPAALARWRVPDGMSCEVHELEPRPGGRFRVSLTYDAGAGEGKSSDSTDTYQGRFLELIPGERVVEAIAFETGDEELRGVMTVCTVLRATAGGTEVEIDHAGIPPGVSEADNRTGTEMALAKLARLLEEAPSAR